MRMLGIVALILFVTGCVSVKSSSMGVEIKSFSFAKYNNDFIFGFYKIKEIRIEESNLCCACCNVDGGVCLCHKE